MSSSVEVSIDKAVPRIRSLYAERRFADVVDVIRSALVDPQSRGDAWKQISNAANSVRDQYAAIEAAARWRNENRRDAEPIYFLATQLLAGGNIEEARKLAVIVCEHFPDNAHAWFTYGNIAAAAGETELAIDCYRKTIAANPQFIAAWERISALKTFEPGDPDLAELDALPARAAPLGDGFVAVAHGACAQAYHKLGDFERAVGHFDRAASLKRFTQPYDMNKQLATMMYAIETFDDALLKRFGGCGDPSEQPIFIVAPPETGGRLVERILSKHSKVRAGGHSGALRVASWSLSDYSAPYVTALSRADNADERWLEIGSQYVVLTEELFGEHERLTNRDHELIAQVGLISLVLPNAKIIYCDRYPLDAGWACFRRQSIDAMPWSTKFEDICRYFAAHRRARETWQERIPGHGLEMPYEALIKEPKDQIDRLLAYCDLEPEAACYDAAMLAEAAALETSFAEWRNYEPYLQTLIAAARRYALI